MSIRRIGLSRFVLGFLSAFILGIFLGDKLIISFAISTALIVAIAVLGAVFSKDKLKLIIIIVFGAFVLGLTYYHFWDWRENQKTITYNQVQEFDGIVQTSLRKGNTQQIVAKYNNTKIQIDGPIYPEFNYGDKLKIKAEIQNPTGLIVNGFDYGNYLFKKGIRGTVKNPEKIDKIGWQGNIIVSSILKISNSFMSILNRELPEPMSTLMIGLLMGLKQQLPDSVTTAFQRTGLSHVTAVSGYNVTIIIIWISYLLMYVSRRVSFFGTILATIIFVILTGAGASVVRAGILAILILLGKFIGRKVYYPILILLTAAMMLSLNPYAIKNDASFQLSFLAFVGLMILSGPISVSKNLSFLPESLRNVLSETIGAQILVLPILIYNFGLVSIIAPLTNILVLPIIPLTMLLGFISGIAGIIWLKLGFIISSFTWLILKYILIVVESFARLPWAAITLKSSEWWWIPIYYLIIYLIVMRQNAKAKS